MVNPNIHSFGEGGPVSPPPPTAEQVAFTEQLGRLNQRLTDPLPDFTANIYHGGEGNDGLVLYYHVLGQRLNNAHLSNDLLAPFRAAGERGPQSYSFTPDPSMQLGREDSHRQAFFGNLQLANAEGGIVQDVPVAVKPFLLTEIGNAVQECAMMQHLAKLGIPSLEPLGIIVHRYRWEGPPLAFMVTRFRPELASLSAEERWLGVTREDMAARLEPVVRTLARLHGAGVSHGDPKFRNIGLGEAEDSDIVYDLEFATSFREFVENVGEDQPVPERVRTLLNQEFLNVRASLREHVYPRLPADQRPKTRREEFELELATFLEPYHIAINESDSPYKSILDRVYRTWLRGHVQDVEAGTAN